MCLDALAPGPRKRDGGDFSSLRVRKEALRVQKTLSFRWGLLCAQCLPARISLTSALTAPQGGRREMGTLPPCDIGKQLVRGEVGTLTQDQSHHARDVDCKGELPRGAGREMGTCT